MDSRNRQLPRAGGDSCEEIIRRAEYRLDVLAFDGKAPDRFDVGLGGAAAVVADAVEAHQLVERRPELGYAALNLADQIARRRPVFIGDPISEHSRKVV